MAIKKDALVFTGSQDDLLTCYVSKGRNIYRKKSSIDTLRIKKDPVFKAFRQSSSRMKQASPIAASLYAMVPARFREYPLYRVLTGAALKLLKQGIAEKVIETRLKQAYIDPLIVEFLKARRTVTTPRPESHSPFSYGSLSTTPPTRNRRRIRSRRVRTQAVEALPLTACKGHIRYMPGIERVSYTPIPPEDSHAVAGLIYLGRLKEASKLKMYQREDFTGLMIGSGVVLPDTIVPSGCQSQA